MFQILAATALAVSTLAASTSSTEYQGDYGKALAATRTDQRPLLVVLDIPSDPQASLDANLLDQSGAAAAALKPFNVCHVDVSTDYGRKVAEAFHATSFPHTAIIDKTGAVVIHNQPGKIADDQWQSMLVKYQDGQQPVTQTSYYRGAVATSGTVMGTMYPNCPACQRKAMGMSF